MVGNLHKNGIVSSERVVRAMGLVDRGFFTPEGATASAYVDAPLRAGPIHLSAPHIYGAVLNTLEFGLGDSFLNVGSGSGYLSTVCAVLGGPTSLSHGVECNFETFTFSQGRVAAFQAAAAAQGINIADVRIVHANIFDVADLDEAHNLKPPSNPLAPPTVVFYDRIYVGAGCPLPLKDTLLERLALGGVLVAPVGDELIKVKGSRGGKGERLLCRDTQVKK
jgi:protein-L-isoaspartate O-methyltransferase